MLTFAHLNMCFPCAKLRKYNARSQYAFLSVAGFHIKVCKKKEMSAETLTHSTALCVFNELR